MSDAENTTTETTEPETSAPEVVETPEATEPQAEAADVEAAPAEEANYATNPPTHEWNPITGAWDEIDIHTLEATA